LPLGIDYAISGVLVKPLECLPEQPLGRVFYSPAPLFLALALLKGGVVLPERSNLGLDAWSFISVTSPSWGIWWRCRPAVLTVVSIKLGARVFLDPYEIHFNCFSMLIKLQLFS
jgi:hypothetical protein